MREPDRNSPQDFQHQAGSAPLPSLASSTDTEAMGDFHFSSESYSLALEYFEKAYRQAQTESQGADLWRLAFKLGESYHRKGLENEAREWFLLSQSRLKGREETLEYGLVLDRIGMVHLYTSSPEEALRFCFQAYELLKNSSLHAEVAENLNRIAIIYSRLGYPREAEEFFTDALVTYRRIDDHRGIIGATMNLGLLKKNACDFEAALGLFNKSMALAAEHSLRGVHISLLLNIGIVYFKQGRHRDASEMFIRARRLAREAGDEAKTTRGTLSLGRVQIQLGNFRRAEQLLLEGRVLAEKNRQQRSLALSGEFLGELYEARDDLEAALANYELSLDLARQLAPKGDVVVEVMQRIARVKLRQGLPLEAIRVAEKALKLTETNGELFEIPHLYRTQARAWLRLENGDKSEIAFRNALQAFQLTQEQIEQDQTKLEYAELLFSRATLEDALRSRKLLEDLLQNQSEGPATASASMPACCWPASRAGWAISTAPCSPSSTPRATCPRMQRMTNATPSTACAWTWNSARSHRAPGASASCPARRRCPSAAARTCPRISASPGAACSRSATPMPAASAWTARTAAPSSSSRA
ncbi:MAG: tetratricopeptide repeat protein [Candidatus Krumholzibacteriia bacterium]